MNITARYFLYGLLSCCIAIVICGVGVLYFGHKIDQAQRKELLKQAHYASLLVTPTDIAALSATDADLSNAVYQRVKSNFTSFRSFNENIRFVYLIGYQPETRTQFFYVDSEPMTSPDYSPPGQLYPEATSEDIEKYHAGQPYTQGPYNDRWGEWVSGNVFIYNAQGDVVAMLGIDIATHIWDNEIVFVRGAFIVIAFLLCLVIYFFTHRFYKKERSMGQLKNQNIKLQHNESKLVEIQSLAQVGKVIIYFSNNTVLIDDQFASLYKNKGPRMSLSDFMSLIHPDDVALTEASFNEIKEKDINYSWFDIRIGSQEGGFRKYHFYGNVERGTSREAERFSGIMQDITDIA